MIKQLQQPKALKAVTIVLACATAALFYQIVRVILEDSRAILELSTYSITLDGPTATSERVAGTITLRNAGRSELTIREMRLSCNCIKVVVDSRKIGGRGQTTLHLSAVPSDVASKEVFLLMGLQQNLWVKAASEYASARPPRVMGSRIVIAQRGKPSSRRIAAEIGHGIAASAA